MKNKKIFWIVVVIIHKIIAVDFIKDKKVKETVKY